MSFSFFGASLNPEQASKIEELRKNVTNIDSVLEALQKPLVAWDDIKIIAKSLGKLDEKTGFPRRYTKEEATEIAKLLAESKGSINDLYSREESVSSFVKARNELSSFQFAQEVGTAASPVIAKQIIEEAVSRRIFPIDEITMGNTKKYTLVGNEKAVWVGKYGEGMANLITELPNFYVSPELQEACQDLDMTDIMDSDFDIVNYKISMLGKTIVNNEDKAMFELLFKATSKGRASTTANAIYPYGDSAPPLTDEWEDNCFYLPDGDEPTIQDLLAMKAKLEQKGYKASAMLINPYLLAIFLSQQPVLYATNFGSNEVQRTGTVKMLAGITPIMSRLIPADRLYMFDVDNSAAIVQREPIYTETEKKKRIIEITAYSRTACVVKNINAVIALQTYGL